ncbi:DUF4097 family beta strand repeat-containing protein [Runella sp.]|uniref:DUF4097 family beta strand repeat-containing protein n=1 Tax=Runella sp. TaxID=1960881 RepID=UPI003D104BFF
MKSYSLLLSFLFVVSVVFAQNSDEKPYMTKTFNASSVKNLNVRTSGGSINVAGQGGDAKVEVYIRANNWNGRSELSKEEIEDRLKEYELTVAMEGETLVCKSKRKNENDKWDWKQSLSISFKITVPEKTTTDLATSGGSIKLAKLSGTQNFSTSGGSLHLDDLSGMIKGRTSGGSIQLINCQDQLDLATSGGSIKAESCKGDIKLVTSGGSIHLDGLNGNVRATTSGGSIKGGDIKGELLASTSGGSIRLTGVAASLKASTSAGGIDAEIVALGKFLDLSTSAGGIHVQMPMNKGLDLDLRANRVNVGTLKNFDGTLEKDRVNGRLNGGGTLVTMRASSGSISVND